jgi:hypothetical protein
MDDFGDDLDDDMRIPFHYELKYVVMNCYLNPPE